jgi:hypothetical protein
LNIKYGTLIILYTTGESASAAAASIKDKSKGAAFPLPTRSLPELLGILMRFWLSPTLDLWAAAVSSAICKVDSWIASQNAAH